MNGKGLWMKRLFSFMCGWGYWYFSVIFDVVAMQMRAGYISKNSLTAQKRYPFLIMISLFIYSIEQLMFWHNLGLWAAETFVYWCMYAWLAYVSQSHEVIEMGPYTLITHTYIIPWHHVCMLQIEFMVTKIGLLHLIFFLIFLQQANIFDMK